MNILNWYELLATAKIDIIDASAVRSDISGHSYDQPALFEDLRGLIRGKTLTEREHRTLEKDPVAGVYRLLPSAAYLTDVLKPLTS